MEHKMPALLNICVYYMFVYFVGMQISQINVDNLYCKQHSLIRDININVYTQKIIRKRSSLNEK